MGGSLGTSGVELCPGLRNLSSGPCRGLLRGSHTPEAAGSVCGELRLPLEEPTVPPRPEQEQEALGSGKTAWGWGWGVGLA